jgi:hypothetical protein
MSYHGRKYTDDKDYFANGYGETVWHRIGQLILLFVLIYIVTAIVKGTIWTYNAFID